MKISQMGLGKTNIKLEKNIEMRSDLGDIC